MPTEPRPWGVVEAPGAQVSHTASFGMQAVREADSCPAPKDRLTGGRPCWFFCNHPESDWAAPVRLTQDAGAIGAESRKLAVRLAGTPGGRNGQ